MRVFYALVGALALAGFILYMAPATLLAIALGEDAPVRLTQVQGRIWGGTAAVAYQGHALGSLSWQFAPARLLRGEADIDWRLASAGHTLSGRAGADFGGLHCLAAGELREAAVRRILAPYWIETTGDIFIERIDVGATHGLLLEDLAGELSWSGGEVRYRLAGEHHRMVLPPLAGVLESADAQPALTVFAQGIDTPLLHARLDADGWLTIGVTKKMTKMAGFPWPGNNPDNEIVIDVSERLF